MTGVLTGALDPAEQRTDLLDEERHRGTDRNDLRHLHRLGHHGIVAAPSALRRSREPKQVKSWTIAHQRPPLTYLRLSCDCDIRLAVHHHLRPAKRLVGQTDDLIFPPADRDRRQHTAP